MMIFEYRCDEIADAKGKVTTFEDNMSFPDLEFKER